MKKYALPLHIMADDLGYSDIHAFGGEISMPNLDAFVAIGSEDAARMGLQPARDSIGIEDARSPYANVLTVRDADRAQPWVAPLAAAYHSDDVARFILARYQDSVRRPW